MSSISILFHLFRDLYQQTIKLSIFKYKNTNSKIMRFFENSDDSTAIHKALMEYTQSTDKNSKQ